MGPNILVAGIGNLFLTDDGFGPEVARRLQEHGLPTPGVKVVDYGIRGMHLAYDLLDGVDALVIVDALPGDGLPGEVTVLEVGPADVTGGGLDTHGMDPVTVLTSLQALGGTMPPTYVVGCRPESVEEGIGLTPTVADAVPIAADAVKRLVQRLATATPTRGR